MPRSLLKLSLLVVVITMLLVPSICEVSNEYNYEYQSEECHPEEADTCFEDVNENLMCNLGRPATRNCLGRDARDLCQSMGDALACCSDVLTSCTQNDGIESFSVWLTGLRGVHYHLCNETTDLSLITNLLQGSSCFRLKRFLTCVEERANITHVANLLTTHLDLHECNRLQVSVAACVEDAEKNKGRCRGKAQVVNEALIVFFASTGCGHAPTRPIAPSPLPCVSPMVPMTEMGKSTTSSIATTTTPRQDNTTSSNSSSTNHMTQNEIITSNSDDNMSSNEKFNTPTTITTTTITTPITTTSTSTTSGGKQSRSITNSSRENNISDNTTTTTIITTAIACQQVQNFTTTTSKKTASTVVVTALVTVVVVMLAALVLVKRGVLLFRTGPDRRLISLQNDDISTAYDRF